MSIGWPATLRCGPVTLRPLAIRDRRDWESIRARNVDWLKQWDATLPPGASDAAVTFKGMVRSLRAAARAGTTWPFALDVDGRLRGQVTVGGIHLGSLRGAHIGYWIDQQAAGQGYMPLAVAMASDHCFGSGLHRVEINIRPENLPSIRVVEKLGFREEGLRLRYLHINGQWRDHLSYALTVEEIKQPLVHAYIQQYGPVPHPADRTRRTNPGTS